MILYYPWSVTSFFLIPNKSLLNFIKYSDELGQGTSHCGNANFIRDSKSFENLYSSCKCEVLLLHKFRQFSMFSTIEKLQLLTKSVS